MPPRPIRHPASFHQDDRIPVANASALKRQPMQSMRLRNVSVRTFGMELLHGELNRFQ